MQLRARTEAERTAIHAVGWTLQCGSGGQTAERSGSLEITGLACSVFASPTKMGDLFRSTMASTDFWSMVGVRDNTEVALSKKAAIQGGSCQLVGSAFGLAY